MSLLPQPKGVVVPLATPLDSTENLDTKGLERLLNHVLNGGVHGIFLNGTTGEFPGVRDRDLERLVAASVGIVAGRAEVWLGVGATTTRDTLRYMSTFQGFGLSGWVVVTPYYISHDENSLIRHYTVLASATDLPLLIYSIPQFATNHLSLEAVTHLSSIDNIVGIKESSGDREYFRNLLEVASQNFVVAQGSEPDLADALQHGSRAIVPGLANLVPNLFVELFDAGIAGEREAAANHQARLDAIRGLYAEMHWLTGLKGALSLVGICGPTCFAPVETATGHTLDRLRQYLEDYKLLAG